MTGTIEFYPLQTLIGLTNKSFYSDVFELAGYQKMLVNCRVYGQIGTTNLSIDIEYSQDLRTWDETQAVTLDAVTSLTGIFRYARCKVDIDNGTAATFFVIARAVPME